MKLKKAFESIGNQTYRKPVCKRSESRREDELPFMVPHWFLATCSRGQPVHKNRLSITVMIIIIRRRTRSPPLVSCLIVQMKHESV